MAAAFIELTAIKLVSFCPTVSAGTTPRLSLRRNESRTNISHKQIILQIGHFFLQIDYSKTSDGILISTEALSALFSEVSEVVIELLVLSF